MGIKPLLLSTALVTLLKSLSVVAQTSDFTYQGRLNQNGAPASGVYDFRFAVYDAPTGGTVAGQILTNVATSISNGQFTASLDFGNGVFTGPPRWLELAVRTNGADAFDSINPRQRLTATPYAFYAPSAGTAATAQFSAAAQTVFDGQGMTNLSASQITVGTIPDAVLSSNVATVAAVPSGNSLNLYRMGRIHSLLQTRDTSTNPVTLVAFGDSVSEYDRSPQRILFRTMACLFGLQEANRDDDQFQLSWNAAVLDGGTARISGPDVNWISDYWQIPPGGTLMLTNYFDFARGYVWARGFEVIYLAQPAGGSFEVQLDSGAGFSTIAVVNASATGSVIRSTNIVVSVGGLVQGRIRLAGMSGTNDVMTCLPMLSVAPARDKLRIIHSGKGGIGLDQFLGVSSNILWSTFATYKPDLFAFHMKHEYSLTPANLAALTLLVTNASPGCEMLFFGTPPAVIDPNWAAANNVLRGFCQSNGWMYVDLASQVPNAAYMSDQNWFTSNDGLHPTLQAYDSMLRPFVAAWGWGTPCQSGQRLSSLAIGAPQVTDPRTPFAVTGGHTGGSVQVTFSDATVGTAFRMNGFTAEYADYLNVFHLTGGGRHSFAIGQDWFNGFVGAFTPNKGFYVGTNYAKDDVASGQIVADNSVATKTFIASGSVGLTTNVQVLMPGPKTNVLVFKGGILADIQ